MEGNSLLRRSGGGSQFDEKYFRGGGNPDRERANANSTSHQQVCAVTVMPSMPVAELCVMMARKQCLAEPCDLPSVRVARKRQIDSGMSRLTKEIRVVGQQHCRFVVGKARQRRFKIRPARREVVDACDPHGS